MRPSGRCAKILGTLGPASADENVLRAMIEAGMNGARLNFSHGREEDHRRIYASVRRAAADRGQPVAVLQDLQGPKIRLGRLPNGRVTLEAGASLRIIHAERSEDASVLPCNYEPLPRDTNPGDRILLDDGRVVLRVQRSGADEVLCEVAVGGEVSDHKGINLPGVPLSTPALTDKDRRDIAVGRELGVDYVALSFVRSADDIAEARALVGETPIVAKIEKPEAVEQIDAILEVVDGIMVARGDLGVEIGPENVPMLQKQLIQQANAHGRLVITATEMLESMRTNPRPTRAEVSDVANAVLDGTDTVMLSAETAAGHYPVEAVATMHRIVCRTEAANAYNERVASPPSSIHRCETTSAIARASVVAAEEADTDAIICYTESGALALMTSEFRPRARLIAATQDSRLYDRLALHWGVIPLPLPRAPTTAEAVVDAVIDAALAANLLQPGQHVVIAAGSRLDGPSDLIKIHHVPDRPGSAEPARICKGESFNNGKG